MPCAVNYRDDPGWYRAVVREMGRNEVRVAFVDWGNCQVTKFSDIKPLAKRFGGYPPMAIRCRVDGEKNIFNFRFIGTFSVLTYFARRQRPVCESKNRQNVLARNRIGQNVG